MLSIPRRHERPLADLVAMSQEERERVVNEIREAAPALDLGVLAEKVASSTELDEDRALGLVRMLASLYRAREETPVDQFVDDVCDAAQASGKARLQPTDENGDSFRRDLKALLSCDQSLGVTAKATDIRLQHQNVYCRARILTDIRPVFKQDVAEEPPAGVIIHTLRMTTHQEGDFSASKDFYVALDALDLRELRTLVDRAIRKEETLKSLIARTGMTWLELGGH